MKKTPFIDTPGSYGRSPILLESHNLRRKVRVLAAVLFTTYFGLAIAGLIWAINAYN